MAFMINPASNPYHNLLLTGHIGVGKLNIVRMIARQVNVSFVDLDTEIQTREGIPPDEIRQLFGESRLRTIENNLCRELSLQRGAVLSVNGSSLMDEVNRERLAASGPILILTCSLNEILRRLYAAQGARFHDPKVRSAALNQIRREQQVWQLKELPTLDTTYLSAEQAAARAVEFWYEQETLVAV
jgi:shikimate kinase